MRILLISDKILTRSLGDGLRVYGLLRQLTADHQFDLICFAPIGMNLDPEFRDIFRKITLIPAPALSRRPFLRRLSQSFTADDFKLTSEPMRAAVAAAACGQHYDLILEEAANSLLNLPSEPLGAPLVVDSIDEPLLREFRAFRHGAWRAKPRHLYRAWRFWKYEKALLGRAALNIYVSEVDAGVYRRFFPGRPVAVVPNGVDVDYFAPMEIGADKDYVVFEGNMDFAPNIDTARRLALEILPLLSKHAPNVRIGLVGRDPAPEVRQLASSRVEVTGTVDDVRPYLAKASVFACPMKLGSGIKNKILQAWAMGRPVVATSTSLGGLSALDGVNILVRDTPKAFAAAVANVISDPELAKSIGAAGRATAVREYSWQQRAKQLDSLLKAVVSRTEEFRGTGQAPIVATMARPHGSLKEPG